MTAEQILSIYEADPFIKTLGLQQKAGKLTGLKGSFLAFLVASLDSMQKRDILINMKDRESAAYLRDDIQNLLPNKEVLMFPSSYKKPYVVEETENAQVLQRTEVLNRLQQKERPCEIIVTYADALTERVVRKKALLDNTFSVQLGEKINSEFVVELLNTYGFERADFVYEPGQYAVRGGIIDIFSFGNDNPYRLELFGDEVDDIRTFNPDDQLSVEKLTRISIIPNIQDKLQSAEREHFTTYLRKGALVISEGLSYMEEVITQYYQKATERFRAIVNSAGGTQVILAPDEVYESPASFEKSLENHTLIQFEGGSYKPLENAEELVFDCQAQPSFNKNFDLLVSDLKNNTEKGFTNILTAETRSQLQRLETILEEIGKDNLSFHPLLLGLNRGFIDNERHLAIYTDHEIFEKFHRYKARDKTSKSKALTLKEIKTLQPGDYVTHIDHGIGRFAGMETVDVGDKKQEAIRLIYRDNDLLLVSVHSIHKIAKYSGREGQAPQVSKLGSAEWENKKKRVKKRLKDIAKDLISLYAKRRESEGFSFQQDSYMQAELESSFLYEDTPDQARATEEVKNDMMKPYPMDRLVCGDVGFGKTEVAIRAAFKAVLGGKQVAVLVPTTILAMQHYHTFSNRLKDMPVKVSFINRFKSTKEIRETIKQLNEGKIDIIIGTHRLVSKDIVFKNLGLLVIDEEQKFGVKVKDRLKELKVNVDVLTLTATPIPRTLHFSLMGARDLSVINTPPPNRQPVTTEIHAFNEAVIRDAISFEVDRGGQVFFVNNRINDINEIAGLIQRLVPGTRVAAAHGQMDGTKLEKIMLDFIEGRYDVLVSTNIIESGLDIPNANTIIINHAHMFGLSDLHQMRGRVGRSNVKAYCYLLAPTISGFTVDARKRLTTLEEFSDLGDGFKVAMRDLDIRGAGDLLGAEQSGFINDLGFDTYHKMLDEAVGELKENEFKSLFEKVEPNEFPAEKEFVKETNIETDLELLIPNDYVKNISERLSLYTRLDNIEKEAELTAFAVEVKDRFGPIPEPVSDLIESVRLRWDARNAGFEKLKIKNGEMRGYLIDENNKDFYASAHFTSLLNYVQMHPKKCRMKHIKNRPLVVFSDVSTIQEARNILAEIRSIEHALAKQ